MNAHYSVFAAVEDGTGEWQVSCSLPTLTGRCRVECPLPQAAMGSSRHVAVIQRCEHFTKHIALLDAGATENFQPLSNRSSISSIASNVGPSYSRSSPS